jgi:hypothetical protein
MLVLAALVIVGCVVFLAWPRRDVNPKREFYDRLAQGAGCAELIDIRAQVDESDLEHAAMGKRLADMDCLGDAISGWKLVSEPDKVTEGRDIVGISAELVWRGDEGTAMGARCSAALLDEDQEVAFEGSVVIERPGPSELDDPPYRTKAHIPFGGKRFFGVENYYVDRFECRSG